MKKSRLQSFKDYMAVLVRRKWWILGSFIIFAGLAGLFATIVPDTYISESTILIEPRDIPKELVADLTNSNTEQRMVIIQEKIKSDKHLEAILDEFDEVRNEYRGLPDQVKMMKLRDKITIDFPTQRVRGSYLPLTIIEISYRNRNPELARKVTDKLTSLFLQEDREAREEDVDGTANFLQLELNKVAEELRESEKKLQELRSKYPYELPDQLDTNLKTLDRLQIDKQSNIEELSRLKSLKIDLEQQMALVPPEIPREQVQRATPIDPAVQTHRRKEQELTEARATKNESHPDVRRLKAELEELRKSLPAGALDEISERSTTESVDDSKPATLPNPAYQTLKSHLQQIATDIQIGEGRIKGIEEEMALIKKRVDKTPARAQELAEPIRENEALIRQYDKLKADLDEATMSKSAESSEKGAHLDNISPASYPMEPAPPSRSVIFIIGMLLSLGLGIGVAFAVDIASPVVFTQSELERVLQVKVLVEIPRITTPSDIRKSRVLASVYGVCFLLLTSAYGGVLYFLYTKKDKLAQILDPVIQRLQG